MTCVVYGLASTADGKIRYVGQTVRDPQKRYWNHLAQARRYPLRHLSRWIAATVASRHRVMWWIIEADAVWGETEQRLIAWYRAHEARLVNGTSGGDGVLGREWTAAQRAHMSRMMTGKKKSAEHVAKMSAHMTGRRPSPEAVEKQRATIKGRRPKNLDAIHARMVGRAMPMATREKLSLALKGRPRGAREGSHVVR